MTALDQAFLEAAPLGHHADRKVDQVALCRVRTFASDTRRDVELADHLERSNRRALEAWLASGRAI